MVQAVHYFSNYGIESRAETPACDNASTNFIWLKIDLRNIQETCKCRCTYFFFNKNIQQLDGYENIPFDGVRHGGNVSLWGYPCEPRSIRDGKTELTLQVCSLKYQNRQLQTIHLTRETFEFLHSN
jgi:hypothetical protein